MRLSKALPAVVVVAMTGIFFAGGGPASGSVLCSTNAAPCLEANTYSLETSLKGELTGGSTTFVGEASTQICEKSSIGGKYTNAGAPVAGAEITSLTFSGCNYSCVVEARHLPYKAEVKSTGGGNAEMTLRDGGSGAPQIKNYCSGLSCTFGAEKISLDLSGGSPANIQAINEPLVREAGERVICKETAKWNAKYELSTPKPVYVQPGSRKLYFGISANTRSFKNPGAEQDLVAETGADRLREDLEWDKVEPSNGSWEWAATDSLYEAAAERELSILPILDSSPCWAVPKETEEKDCWRTYPTSNADFADFAAHAAARYGPGGEFWTGHPKLDESLAPRYFEIWNEPYFPQFTNGNVDPARYATLYKAAVVAGRAANSSTRYLVESTVDVPNPKGPGWVNWAKGMVEAEPEIGSYVDAIAVHPYPGSHDPYYTPKSGTDASFKNTNRIYEDWVSQGIRRPIWITEVGYSSCNDGAVECVPGATQSAREEQKATWLAELFDEVGSEEYGFVHAIYLYDLRQWLPASSPTKVPSEWFGILDGEAEQLPAWSAFSGALEKFAGTPLTHAIITGHTIGGGNASFTFTAIDSTATFSCQLDSGSWASCTSPKSYTGLSGSHTFRVKATNAEGAEPTPASYSW
jgi:hypothetical protein